MFNKYAELRKIALLYTACRGLLRIKIAAPVLNSAKGMQPQEVLTSMQKGLFTPEVMQQIRANPDQYGLRRKGTAQPQQQPQQQSNTTQLQPYQQPPQQQPQQQSQQQPQQQRKPVNPMQLKMMSQQQYMQNHQKQIQQAGQQAQQNANNGWFGKAMNWLTGGGYGGFMAGRAQQQKQQYYNNRYNQQAQQLKQRQQQYQRRQTGQQIQNFLMNGPYKSAGYNLLKLFPGYQQLFNYV